MKKVNEAPTLSQKFLKDRQLLTKRPEGMDYNEYKYLLKLQTNFLRQLLK